MTSHSRKKPLKLVKMENVVLFRWAISLEIFGFLLASIFGLILLNREVLGSYAEKLDKQFTGRIDKFQKRFDNRANPLYVLAHVVSEDVKVPHSLVFYFISRFLWLMVMVSGLLFNVSWLFWVGLVLFTFGFVTKIIAVIRMTRIRTSGAYFPTFLVFLFTAILLDYCIVPFVIIAVFIIRLAKFFSRMLSTTDTIKRILITVGSIMVAVGLILEAISMW